MRKVYEVYGRYQSSVSKVPLIKETKIGYFLGKPKSIRKYLEKTRKDFTDFRFVKVNKLLLKIIDDSGNEMLEIPFRY